MKLQILIPHYRAPYDMVKRLLVSIAQQQNVDFNEIEVIICNDGEDVLFSEDKLKEYPFNIKYIVQEHGGVSVARNTCLDAADAEYVMFCDEDDMFIDMLGLWYILGDTEEPKYDILYSSFLESYMENGELKFITHDIDDTTFLHGKLFRRQFLLDNNIRFIPSFTAHEDEYFVSLAFGCLNSRERADYFDRPFYLWRWNDNSVCRKEEKYAFKIYTFISDMYDAIVESFLERNNMGEAQYFCGVCFFEIFYSVNRPDWLDENNVGYKESMENNFAKFYKKYIDLFNSIDADSLYFINNEVRGTEIKMGLEMEVITFSDWLDHIKELSKQLPE